MIQSIDYVAIAAPLILALVAGAVLLLDAFLPRRTPGVLGLVTLAGVVAAFGVVVAQAVGGGERRTFCVPASLGGGGCSFVVDGFTLVLSGLLLGAGAVVVLLSMGELADRRIPAGEWYFLLLCALAGAVLLPAARDLATLVVALEVVSLPVFALTALKRYDGRASEAALKLFLVSVVSTAIMLFGISLLYGLTGTLYLERLSAALSSTAPGASGAVSVAVVLVLAGFAFKVAAVPFHFWAGDVYQGAPVPVAALLSVVSKAAGFAGLILILTTGLPGQAAVWGPVVAVVAALTMTAGNVLALRQRAALRLLAWSSVAQSGYILAPLAVIGGRAVSASVAYLVIYAAMNLGAFAVVMLVSRTAPRNELDDYRGLASQRPGTAVALGFFLVCLAGLPPGLAGLFAKVVVFREIVAGGLGWLAVVMAVNTVIGLYYYIAWTAQLFTPGPAGVSRTRSVPVMVAVGVAVLVTLAFCVAPQLVLSASG
ncbi:NADH-quinone oxidoreductase subunit N [Microtetraspora sp. NBRC 16547]|uniref:NADH-quinone oxidoreductase subunit N n=1 Tax=Microtetraspora sp. NBRC 16547 TaxID=3030993 RepID=UPI0024A0DEC8|nr:NADH-quinone oxidoreductase subunit N [Microtetraspora sp. NBRC 16547]GLW99567.1 NADH-quinone oxidoreductase subunit N [Microtetraspora sp. NBRC 16547]